MTEGNTKAGNTMTESNTKAGNTMTEGNTKAGNTMTEDNTRSEDYSRQSSLKEFQQATPPYAKKEAQAKCTEEYCISREGDHWTGHCPSGGGEEVSTEGGQQGHTGQIKAAWGQNGNLTCQCRQSGVHNHGCSRCGEEGCWQFGTIRGPVVCFSSYGGSVWNNNDGDGGGNRAGVHSNEGEEEDHLRRQCPHSESQAASHFGATSGPVVCFSTRSCGSSVSNEDDGVDGGNRASAHSDDGDAERWEEGRLRSQCPHSGGSRAGANSDFGGEEGRLRSQCPHSGGSRAGAHSDDGDAERGEEGHLRQQFPHSESHAVSCFGATRGPVVCFSSCGGSVSNDDDDDGGGGGDNDGAYDGYGEGHLKQQYPHSESHAASCFRATRGAVVCFSSCGGSFSNDDDDGGGGGDSDGAHNSDGHVERGEGHLRQQCSYSESHAVSRFPVSRGAVLCCSSCDNSISDDDDGDGGGNTAGVHSHDHEEEGHLRRQFPGVHSHDHEEEGHLRRQFPGVHSHDHEEEGHLRRQFPGVHSHDHEEEGHLRRQFPHSESQAASRFGATRGPVLCFGGCGSSGVTRSRTGCYRCDEEGHHARHCPYTSHTGN